MTRERMDRLARAVSPQPVNHSLLLNNGISSFFALLQTASSMERHEAWAVVRDLFSRKD